METNKELIQLQELIRKVDSLISPMTYDDTLKNLMVNSATDVFKGDFTKCVVPWKVGAQLVNLPVCNRFGMVDPKMIEFSKKMVNKMKSVSPQYDEGSIIIMAKLDKIFKKYNKKVPKPSDRAAKHGQMTKYTNRIINNIKGHLT